ERGVRWLDHVRAVLVLDEPAARDPAELVLGDIVAGQHREHAMRLRGRRRVDLLDLRVRVRRSHEHRVGLMGKLDVVGVLALAGQAPAVFLPLAARADALVRLPFPPLMPPAPAITLLTMLW